MGTIVLDHDDMRRTLVRIAHEIVEKNPEGAIALVGIQRRGAVLARRLQALTSELLEPAVPLGDVDISFYRDDFAIRPSAPVVHATHLEFPVDGRSLRADRDHVGAQALGRELERRARPRARLVKQVHDRPAAQRGDLLDLAPGDLVERFRAIEDPFDRRAVEVVDREQMGPDSGHAATRVGVAAGPIVTSSTPSISSTRTFTLWSWEVGMFLPT